MLFAADLALVLFAWRLSPLVQPEGAGPWTRALTTVTVGVGSLWGLTLLTGVLGVASGPALLAGAWLLLGLAVVLERRLEPVDDGGRAEGLDPWTVLPATLLGATAGLWAAGPALEGPSFVFDDLTYHAAVPLHWAKTGGFGYSELTYQSYYPFGAELPALWAYLLSGGLGPTGVGVVLAGLLAVLGSLALLERLEVPTAAGLAWGAAFLMSPEVFVHTASFSANDVVVAAWMVVGLAFAAGPPTRRNALWTGLALGAALGTKVSVAPGVLLVGLWWLARARRDPWLPVLVVLGSLPLGAWWYLHNLVMTGNPLFPAAMGPFDGPLDRDAQRHTTLLRFMLADGADPAFWRALYLNRFDWPVWFGTLSLAGYGAGLVRGRERKAAWLAVAVGLLVLALFPLQPYSGTINRPFGGLHKMVRYTTFSTLLGIVLFAASWREGWLRKALVLGGCLAWAVFVSGRRDRLDGLDLGMAGLGVVAAWAVLWMPRLPQRARLLPLALAGLVLLDTGVQRKSDLAWDHLVGFAKTGDRHREAWEALDALPPTRVAWISDLPSSHTFAAPLYGSRQQHELVPVDRQGRLLEVPLHARWEPGGSWWDDFGEQDYDEEAVLDALLAGPAQTLVLSRCQRSPRGPWPAPHAALLARAEGARLLESRCAEVWDLDGVRE